MEEPSLYVRDGDGYVGTVMIQGGWHPDQANGGAVLALVGHCLEDVPTLAPMTLSRLTADLVRPVPLGRRLDVETRVEREGKKIQVVSVTLLVEGVEHVRTTALRLRTADLSAAAVPPSTTDARPADALVPVAEVLPFSARADDLPEGYQPPGFLQGIDMRRAPHRSGDGSGGWLRLRVPVVAGEPVRATSRMTFAFDFANLIGVDVRPDEVTMINPDVNAHVLRPPTGEWIAITGDTRFLPTAGRGISTATLSDDDGPFAVVSISQLVQAR